MHDYRHAQQSTRIPFREPFREPFGPLTSFPSTSSRYGGGGSQHGTGGPRRTSTKRHGAHSRGQHNRGYQGQDYHPSLQSLQSANRARMQRHFPRGRFSICSQPYRSYRSYKATSKHKVLRPYVSFPQGPGNETPRQAPWDAPDAPRRPDSFLYPTPTPGESNE